MSGDSLVLSTDEIRNAFSQTSVWLPGIPLREYGAEFDRWLAEHDREVLIRYEERRKPDPIHVDNIDGESAKHWLAQHDREVTTRAVDTFEDLYFGGAGQTREWVAKIARQRLGLPPRLPND